MTKVLGPCHLQICWSAFSTGSLNGLWDKRAHIAHCLPRDAGGRGLFSVFRIRLDHTLTRAASDSVTPPPPCSSPAGQQKFNKKGQTRTQSLHGPILSCILFAHFHLSTHFPVLLKKGGGKMG